MMRKSFIFVAILFFIASVLMFLAISCTENNFSPEEKPRSVAWVKVKTGLADSTKKPSDVSMSNEQYAYRLNNSGYEVWWSRVDDADYYEVRVSTNIINKKNWDKAILAAIVNNKDTTVIKTVVVVKPDVTGNNCTGCGLCVPACPRNAIQLFKGKAIIDPDSCVGCGQCYGVCPYNAVTNLTLGKYYYFAVRAFTDDNIPAENMASTHASYILRYTNVDTLELLPGIFKRWCGFCGKGCYILDPKGTNNIELGGCPVNAIFYDKDGLIYIDQSKCIYCGLCVLECGYNKGFWSPRREVRSSEWPVENE